MEKKIGIDDNIRKKKTSALNEADALITEESQLQNSVKAFRWAMVLSAVLCCLLATQISRILTDKMKEKRAIAMQELF